jgi:hypothetical protein
MRFSQSRIQLAKSTGPTDQPTSVLVRCDCMSTAVLLLMSNIDTRYIWIACNLCVSVVAVRDVEFTILLLTGLRSFAGVKSQDCP